LPPASPSIHTSKLIKASALIPDTLALLNAWDLSASVSANLAMAQRTNLFGKASRSRVQDILVIFRQRYLEEPDVCAALVHLAQAKAPDAWLRPLLYFFTAQSDATLRDIVLEVIVPRREAGRYRVDADDVARVLSAWVADGRTAGPWGEETIERVAQGALATLRDFGVLRGKANKEIAGIVPPLEAFSLIALWLYQRDDSPRAVLHADAWRLFPLSLAQVERLFFQAHQHHLLSYQAAGSVIRIDFPHDSLEEYAREFVRRAHR